MLIIGLIFFFSISNWPKSQFLFHKSCSPRDFCIMTLVAVACEITIYSILRYSYILTWTHQPLMINWINFLQRCKNASCNFFAVQLFLSKNCRFYGLYSCFSQVTKRRNTLLLIWIFGCACNLETISNAIVCITMAKDRKWNLTTYK